MTVSAVLQWVNTRMLPAALGSLLIMGQALAAITVESVDPVAVKVWNRTIVELRAKIGEASPEERAADIGERIEQIPYSALTDEVRAVPATLAHLRGMQIWVGKRNILGLLPEDLDPELGQSLEQVANQAAYNLREMLAARAEQLRIPVLVRGIGFSAAATALFAFVLWGVVKLRAFALRRLVNMRKGKEMAIFDVNIRPIFVAVERAMVRMTALALGAVAAYVWVTFVLVQFPYSEPWGKHLGGYLIGLLVDLGEGMLGAVPGLFTVLVIFLFTRLVTRGIAGLFYGVESGQISFAGLEPQAAKATRRLITLVIWIFAVTVAYPHIPGSDTAAFKGISVLLGVMISLGSAGFINQLMSNLVIVYSRALEPGDYVRIGETEGVVSHVGALSTKVITRQREEVTIPNAVMTGSTMTNYTRLAAEEGSMASTMLSIGYDTPWRQVHALLQLAADRTRGLKKEPRPTILQRSLSDFYVEYQLLVPLENPQERVPVLSELHANILDAFNEHDVQIMSPHFERQPAEKVTVPRGHWHRAPASETSETMAADQPSE